MTASTRSHSRETTGTSKAAILNPVSTHFEFVGPYAGPIGIILGLPLLVWSASFFMRAGTWSTVPAVPTWDDIKGTVSLEAFVVYAAWWTFQALLYLIVPAHIEEGTVLRDGSRLKYRINGFRCLVITAATVAVVHVYVHPITWIYDNFAQFATAATLFSAGMSVCLYIGSFAGQKLLALGGNSGIPIYDFFIGRELNPQLPVPMLGSIDLKYFNELRPGLFLWILINTAMLIRQLEAGVYDPSMWVVYTLQALYVVDSVYCEDCLLTTMDIIQDGFGFMLAFGDLAWVPFLYSLQARYLADHPLNVSTPFALVCLIAGGIGFAIFRAANAQKDTFKKNPNDASVAGLKYIKTETGSRLLADGWWGSSRHINYFGDWLLSLAMSLTTGFATPITYFYPIYFAVLLIHREMRDEHKCALKYGEAWKQYKKTVPYHIIPYVY